MTPRSCRRSGWLAAMASLLFTSPLQATEVTAVSAVGSGIHPQQKESLGVWLTTVDSNVLYDRAAADEAIRFLRRNGFTRAAVPLLTGGNVQWPVKVERNSFGLSLDPRLEGIDAVPQLLQELHRHSLSTVGWFEFGLMAPADAPWLKGREPLLLRDATGGTIWQESATLDRVWLNPAIPAVRKFLSDLVVDACTSNRLDSIQFDDHLGYPASFGYDPTTLALWRQTPYGKAHPTPAAADPDWTEWRASWITLLLTEIRSAMTRHCPGVRLSIAPNPQDFSYRSYLANWSEWVEHGLVDEVVVQIYRTDLESLSRELAEESLIRAATRVPVRIGILAGLKNQPKANQQLRDELNLVRSRGIAGIDLFFYESARNHFPPAVFPSPPEP